MYKVVSPEWNSTIKDSFESFKDAYNWAKSNCDRYSPWGGVWEIQYYNPSPFVMTI